MIMPEQFLIQVELDPRTRMFCEEEFMRLNIESMVTSIYRTWTEGPEPAVTVVRLVDRDQVNLSQLRE